MKLLINIILIPLVFFTSNCFAQPANDDPCGAILIPVTTDILGQDCTPTPPYSWNVATPTTAIAIPSCVTPGTPNNIIDVWYKLVVPSSGKFKINLNAPDGLYLAIYGTSNCTSTISFSELSCLAYPGGNAPGTLTTSLLTPASTVYLRIMSTPSPTNPAGISILLCASEVLPAIDNTQRVGIGTNNPLAKLDVVGTAIVRDSLLVAKNIETRANLKSNSLQVTGGAVNGNLLQSDANGNGTWVSPSSIGAGQHYIGESFGGGIVFYVYDNGKHGLIAATADQSTGIQWYNGTNRYTGTTGDGLNAGAMNTTMIVATQMADNQTGNFAAKVCADYSVTVGGITYGDWYLPSKYELNLLYLQKSVIGAFNFFYWSSTESDLSNAWYQYFPDGIQYSYSKDFGFVVRAVLDF